MEWKNILKMAVLFFLVGFIFYDIRYISLTKYNVYPQKAIEDYMKETYKKSVSFLSKDFFKDHDICVWSYQCKDETGLIFNMYYEFYRECPETGWTTVFHVENLESGVRDYYWQTRLQDVYHDELIQYRLDYEIGAQYREEKFCIEIKEKNDIDKVAELISEVMYYTVQNVNNPSSETIDISVTCHEEKIYRINGPDIYGVDKEDLYDYIYNGIYVGWKKIEK